MAAWLDEGVCVCVREKGGDMVPQISITGSRAGVNPHTPRMLGHWRPCAPTVGSKRRYKRKSASAW